MTSDEPIDILGAETENRSSSAQTHNRYPRVPTRGVIADPRLRNSQHGGYIIQAEKALTELLTFCNHFFSEEAIF